MVTGIPSVTTSYRTNWGERREIPAFIHVERCWPEIGKLSPCEAACPLQMDIPNYIIAIAQGNFKQALSIIRESNPLPSICGRVCHHPCEAECNRKVIDGEVAIEWLKRYAADRANGEKPAPAPRNKKEKVAIVGSGPAGLTAGHDLVKMGYGVTIFEAADTPGGILSSAIPEFILPLKAVLDDIDYLKALGVKIHTNVNIGQDMSLSGLRRQGYQAILVAIGTQNSAMLDIPGAKLSGVYSALPFLKQAKIGECPPIQGKVWVIGGGAVATDVARTTLRLSADEVHMACLECRADMPAFSWEIAAAEREGVHVHPSLAPQKIVSRDGTSVSGIEFKRVASTHLDNEGRIHWTLVEGTGSGYSAEADVVIIAIGQSPDLSGMLKDKLDINKQGGLSADNRSQQTNVSGIFAAGDISGTGGTVTESMAAGRRAATSIDQYLSKKPISAASNSHEIITIKPEQIPAYFVRKPRWEMPRLQSKEAIRTCNEVDLGYTDWQAIEEAKRCLNCRMCANCIFERGQLCFETANRLL